MTRATIAPEALDPAEALAIVIDRLGPWRVIAAAARALFRPGPPADAVIDVARLNDRMRRDIGLPPAMPGDDASAAVRLSRALGPPPWGLR
jgi:hypothetical protein